MVGTLFIGADHAGVPYKKKLIAYFEKQKIAYKDCGGDGLTPYDDYVDYAKKVCRQVQKHKHAKGILICGTGTGMVMAANKFKGIRAALAYDTYSAKMARHDNDANVLTLRARKFAYTKVEQVVKQWLKTPFSKISRHRRRIKKVDAL